MAFGLTAIDPKSKINNKLYQILSVRDPKKPLIGINISGLIYNNSKAAVSQYGLKADYRILIKDLILRLLESDNLSIVLVPHVLDAPGHYESDLGASQEVLKAIPDHYKSRIYVQDAILNESEVKWVIAQLDWFCGTRMHSTIAGLSTCVPTATISYSDKALGVFSGVGQENAVFDPRELSISEIINGLIQHYLRKESIKKALIQKQIDCNAKMEDQINSIAKLITR